MCVQQSNNIIKGIPLSLCSNHILENIRKGEKLANLHLKKEAEAYRRFTPTKPSRITFSANMRISRNGKGHNTIDSVRMQFRNIITCDFVRSLCCEPKQKLLTT
jgi:hypothetical protein